MNVKDVIVIGGGQAGLSIGFFLRRSKLDYLILDDRNQPGGAWLNTWDSLKLFSPYQYSSLSGWMMPKTREEYPTKTEFIDYLTEYEKRYKFPVQRGIHVESVEKENDLFRIVTNTGVIYSRALVSATGTSGKPFTPTYSGQKLFQGLQIHSVDYINAEALTGKRVMIVGGGNSGAQILAEVSKTTETIWVTQNEPQFLPDDIDGRYLFNAATQRFFESQTHDKPKTSKVPVTLGSIVMVESVKEARTRNVLTSHEIFQSFDQNGVVWKDGSRTPIDVVIWCTGFKASLDHLKSLNIEENGRIATKGTNAVKEPLLWLVGYGSWTGYASATIYGVGKTAKQTVKEIQEQLSSN